ncbi:MAG: anti-anti-sigma factor [Chitinophagaceae bacterium]|nr:anti-anti-sigma factor [Chitinophagaceae bacterium]
MQVKIDTSEKFHVITIREKALSANMTVDIRNKLSSILSDAIKNTILNLEEVDIAAVEVLQEIVKIQEAFHQQNISFISCCVKSAVKIAIYEAGLVQRLNLVPTKSEAMDIIQMEEIERELTGD